MVWRRVSEATPYLLSDRAFLTDERTSDHEQLAIGHGIALLQQAPSRPR